MGSFKSAPSSQNFNSTENWTVVSRRPRKNSVNSYKNVPRKHEEAWEPLDQESDNVAESKLSRRMEVCIENFVKSEYCCSFLNQMETPNFMDKVMKVLGSEKKLRMVIYGIGSIESTFKRPQLQLSLALVMKRKYDWIGDIQIFDPIISLTEMKVLKSLGFDVLSVNEQCRRKATKPIIFFMPHCEVFMYENLLEANWAVDLLNHCVVLGNSFLEYKEQFNMDKTRCCLHSMKHILAAISFTQELKITYSCDDSRAFNSLSWHFFAPTQKEQLVSHES